MIEMKMALLADTRGFEQVIPDDFMRYYEMPRTYVMHMVEQGRLLGAGSVTMLQGGAAKINDAFALEGGWPLRDGLYRALLNFLDVCGVQEVRCGKEALFDDLRKLRFCASDDEMRLSLPGFFDAPCHSEASQGHNAEKSDDLD